LEAHEGAPVELLRGATRRALENLVELALAEQVAFIVIAGDVYDRDWKDYSTGLFFRRQMTRLREARIPVYLIHGNHDAASIISRKLNLPDNVHEFSNRCAQSHPVEGHPVVIHGRSFPNRAVEENLAREYPPAVPGKFNLGLLHTSLNGPCGHDTYAPCAEQDLREKGYHYWALGHVHQPQIISEDPYIVFAGNCQGRHAAVTWSPSMHPWLWNAWSAGPWMFYVGLCSPPISEARRLSPSCSGVSTSRCALRLLRATAGHWQPASSFTAAPHCTARFTARPSIGAPRSSPQPRITAPTLSGWSGCKWPPGRFTS
jgi:predicted phosphodiesterase